MIEIGSAQQAIPKLPFVKPSIIKTKNIGK